MNEAQAQAIAKADDIIRPALELYEQRNKIAYIYYRLDLPSLKRLNHLLRILSDDELRMVAAYAEGLAEFRSSVESLQDAPQVSASGPAGT